MNKLKNNIMTESKKRRYFTGKLFDFDNKTERNFWKKALKAYLKGWTHFTFGRSMTTGEKVSYNTPEIWK